MKPFRRGRKTSRGVRGRVSAFCITIVTKAAGQSKNPNGDENLYLASVGDSDQQRKGTGMITYCNSRSLKEIYLILKYRKGNSRRAYMSSVRGRKSGGQNLQEGVRKRNSVLICLSTGNLMAVRQVVGGG